MSLASDLKVLYHLAVKPVKGDNHAERLDSFYSGQAGAYDDFRKRLLKGREEMYRSIEPKQDAVWVDMGGGTGSNLEFISDRIPALKQAYVVDLASSLLKVCDDRIKERGWNNVKTVEADATTWTPEEGYADVVTFSYSLTMIPDWFAAIDNALRILKPGGTIGVVDFYVSRKFPDESLKRHPWFTRSFWPVWFASDNVFPSRDHVPYLRRHFETTKLEENRAKVPYLLWFKTPYYIFTGTKREAQVRLRPRQPIGTSTNEIGKPMAKSVLSPSFLFQYSVPLNYREKIWQQKPLEYSEEYKLRGFGELDGRKQFADVRGGWNERGVSFTVLVTGKRQPVWCRESRVDESDGFQLWIDTRATHNVHRATRFCHRFAFLPIGAGPSYRDPVGDQLLINRARENANPVRPGDLRVRGTVTKDGYLLECCVPATSLTGYDPSEYDKLGFFYAVMDRELGWQTQSVNTQFPIDEDPSIWTTLELVR